MRRSVSGKGVPAMPLRMSLPECGEGARGIPRGGALRYWHPLKGDAPPELKKHPVLRTGTMLFEKNLTSDCTREP